MPDAAALQFDHSGRPSRVDRRDRIYDADTRRIGVEDDAARGPLQCELSTARPTTRRPFRNFPGPSRRPRSDDIRHHTADHVWHSLAGEAAVAHGVCGSRLAAPGRQSDRCAEYAVKDDRGALGPPAHAQPLAAVSGAVAGGTFGVLRSYNPYATALNMSLNGTLMGLTFYGGVELVRWYMLLLTFRL